MRQVSLIALVSVLALFVSGCPSNEEQEAGGGSSPSPTPVASSPPPKPAPSPSPSATPFANPLTRKQPGNPVAVTGLLQTLPPEARINQAPKGRSDPFAAIPVQPQVVVSPNSGGGRDAGGATAAKPVPVLPQLPPLKAPGADRNRLRTPARGASARTSPAKQPARPTATRATRPTPKPAARPTPPRPGLTIPPPPPFAPELLKPPEPTLARGVEVTGVVDVGGVPRAIVKVPNEPSRYVQAGQRLLNGQVLVKRIEMNRGPEPVVVLEQFGIEVGKRVGERPEGGAGQPGGPTALVPPPPPL